MTVETEQVPVDAGDHVVQFYEHDSELAESVGCSLAQAVDAGGAAVIIATEAHCQAFAAELELAGIDVPASVADGRIISLDAETTLGRFMPDGRIDREAFRQVIEGVVRDAAQVGPVQAYGEMVALLWDAGNVLGAIELEELWNELGQELDFSLLCGYHSSSVSDPEHAEALEQVCHLHTSVLRREDRDPADAGGEVSHRFAAEPAAPGKARRFVSDALQIWGYDRALVDDAQLVVSELATNAVIHARSPFNVAVRAGRGGVRLAVRDQSRAEPRIQSNGHTGPSGRGLQIVAMLAQDWGVDITSGGKAVWAELRR